MVKYPWCALTRGYHTIHKIGSQHECAYPVILHSQYFKLLVIMDSYRMFVWFNIWGCRIKVPVKTSAISKDLHVHIDYRYMHTWHIRMCQCIINIVPGVVPPRGRDGQRCTKCTMAELLLELVFVISCVPFWQSSVRKSFDLFFVHCGLPATSRCYGLFQDVFFMHKGVYIIIVYVHESHESCSNRWMNFGGSSFHGNMSVRQQWMFI